MKKYLKIKFGNPSAGDWPPEAPCRWRKGAGGQACPAPAHRTGPCGRAPGAPPLGLQIPITRSFKVPPPPRRSPRRLSSGRSGGRSPPNVRLLERLKGMTASSAIWTPSLSRLRTWKRFTRKLRWQRIKSFWGRHCSKAERVSRAKMHSWELWSVQPLGAPHREQVAEGEAERSRSLRTSSRSSELHHKFVQHPRAACSASRRTGLGEKGDRMEGIAGDGRLRRAGTEDQLVGRAGGRGSLSVQIPKKDVVFRRMLRPPGEYSTAAQTSWDQMESTRAMASSSAGLLICTEKRIAKILSGRPFDETLADTVPAFLNKHDFDSILK